ncbi:MAG TPA: four-helix bundle copper-binding protein [Rubrobacteraceae bacterium]|nr:four-helix bundle copper-binding protein [Rubrobacteraceae bacterium]
MTLDQRMIETNPSAAALVECIDACFDCARACTACADACLGEQDMQMLVRCIRLDLDRADVCDATGRIFSRQMAFDPEMARATLEACARVCRLCGDECDQHAQHGMEHCRICAKACRRYESVCNNVLSAIVARTCRAMFDIYPGGVYSDSIKQAREGVR